MTSESIRPMAPQDVADVVQIDATSQPNPWSAEVFLRELERKYAFVDVACNEERVVGFCNYWHVDDEVHLLNLSVAPGSRRQGIASRLVEHLFAFMCSHRCAAVILEVRRSNTPARTLYANHGFEQIGVRRNYYLDNREDALVLRATGERLATVS